MPEAHSLKTSDKELTAADLPFEKWPGNQPFAQEKRIALNASVWEVSAVSTGSRSMEEAP